MKAKFQILKKSNFQFFWSYTSKFLSREKVPAIHIIKRATSQAPKRQARRSSQLVLMNLLTFLFQHLSSDLEYFYLEAAGLQKDRRGL